MVEFGRLYPDGTYKVTRNIKQKSMLLCPNFIMVPSHYREDESCKCDDKTHVEMKEWGYKWHKRMNMWL